MTDFIQSFKQISSAEWMEILVLLLVATILGFIIGWLLRSFRVKSLRRLLGEKTGEYDSLNKEHQHKLGFINEMEAENSEMTNRISILNDEIKSLKLKLTNNSQTSAVVLNENDERALVLADEEEPAEEENSTKVGWLNRIKNAFSTNQIVSENEADSEISFEEKLEASNNMIERLLSSNEKLEDDNEKLKQHILDLETKATENNTATTVTKAEPVIVKQELDVEKIDKYTNSLKDAKTTSQDLLKRIEELEIYNGKIIKQLEAETAEKTANQKKLVENGDYKTKYLELAPKFETVEIDNNKLKTELSKLNSTTQSDMLKVELKSKEDALTLSNSEKKSLKIKLEDATKALTNCTEQQQMLKIKMEQAVSKSKITTQTQATPTFIPTVKVPAKEKEAPAITKKNVEVKKPLTEEVKKPVVNEVKKPVIEEIKKPVIKEVNKPELETSHDIMTRIKNKAQSIEFNRIGAGDVNTKDDLKRVKGIGEFVEKKLNALGIYHFKQLAKLTDEDMDKVNDAIEFFPGRIKRDKWVEQAKKFAS